MRISARGVLLVGGALLLLGCGDELDPAANERPTAELTLAEQGRVGVSVDLSGEGSDDLDGWIVRYHYSYGDGSPEEISSSPRARHTFLTPGAFEVELSVVDDRGAKATDRRSITIIDVP